MRNSRDTFYDLRILAVLGLLTLSGLGCKKPGTLYRPTPQNPGLRAESAKVVDPSIYEEREQPKPPASDKTAAEELAPEILYLQQVLKNLSLAETFRADLVLPALGTPANATVAFKKSVGLYGTMEGKTDTGPVKTEVFVNQAAALYRTPGQPWADLSGTEDGNKLARLFSTALLTQSNVSSLLSQRANFIGSEDSAEGCKRYDVSQMLDGSEQKISVCVKADLPTSILVKSASGELKIQYRDINGNVEVFKPSIGT